SLAAKIAASSFVSRALPLRRGAFIFVSLLGWQVLKMPGELRLPCGSVRGLRKFAACRRRTTSARTSDTAPVLPCRGLPPAAPLPEPRHELLNQGPIVGMQP